jgi:hypothetical protein
MLNYAFGKQTAEAFLAANICARPPTIYGANVRFALLFREDSGKKKKRRTPSLNRCLIYALQGKVYGQN